MFAYVVLPKCTDGSTPLALSVTDPGNPSLGVCVTDYQAGKPTSQQSWQVLIVPYDGKLCYALFNPASSCFLGYKGANGPLVLIPASRFGSDPNFASVAWNFPNPIMGGNYGAIQVAEQTTQNLNVKGKGPYPNGTQVLTWEWSGGQLNEVWDIQLVNG